jgi:hypothetical protein
LSLKINRIWWNFFVGPQILMKFGQRIYVRT